MGAPLWRRNTAAQLKAVGRKEIPLYWLCSYFFLICSVELVHWRGMNCGTGQAELSIVCHPYNTAWFIHVLGNRLLNNCKDLSMFIGYPLSALIRKSARVHRHTYTHRQTHTHRVHSHNANNWSGSVITELFHAVCHAVRLFISY